MAIDARGVEVLLVGPRVAHLAPYFEQRHYQVSAHADGEQGADALEEGDPDLVLLELNLGSFAAPDFLALARGVKPRARYLLLDDPTKAGLVVNAIRAGADGYVATPPKEEPLFEEVERLLTSPRPPAGGDDKSAAAIKSLEKQLKNARADLESNQTKKAGGAPDAQVGALKKQLKSAQDKQAAAEAERDALKKAHAAKAGGQQSDLARIADLEGELLLLRTEVEAKDDALGQESDEKNELYRKSKDLMATVAAQKQAMKASESNVTSLMAERDDLRARLEAQEALELVSDEGGSEAAVAELQDQLRDALKAKDALSAEHDELRRLLAETETNADNLEGKNKKLSELRDRLEQDLKNAKDNAGDMTAVQSDLASVRDELGGEIAALKEKLETAEQAAEKLRTELEEVQRERDEMQQRSDEGNKRADSFFERAANAERQLEEQQAALDAAKSAREEAEAAAKAAVEKADAAQKVADAATARADTEAARVRKELEAEIADADRKVAVAEEKAIDKELESDELGQEISRLKKEVEAAKAEHRQSEKAWRQEKLRLVEAQESAGSSDAYRKMEGMLDELKTLRAFKRTHEGS